MALTPFTSTVTATTLRANFNDATATLATSSVAGKKDQTVFLFLSTLVEPTTALSARTIAWTPRDHMEVRCFFLRATDDATFGHTITATLTQDNAGTSYLVDNTISVSVVTVNGTVDSRSSSQYDYRTVTGTRFRLHRDVRYRMTVTMVTAGATATSVIVGLQLRTLRRAA